MLKRLLSIAAVVVGLAAWVSRAHAQNVAIPLWGYMHYADWNYQGCTSCDPSTTPRVSGSLERPYDVAIYDLTDPDAPVIIPEYVVLSGYWAYRTYEVHTGHTYRIIVTKHSSSAGACAIQSCIYQVTWDGWVQQDVKMHANKDEIPYGRDVGPSSYTNPCNPDGVKLAWAGGALRIRAEKPAKLNLKLYDVSGKLLLEKRVSVKAGESTVELPVKGLNVLVVEGDNLTRTIKVVK